MRLRMFEHRNSKSRTWYWDAIISQPIANLPRIFTYSKEPMTTKNSSIMKCDASFLTFILTMFTEKVRIVILFFAFIERSKVHKLLKWKNKVSWSWKTKNEKSLSHEGAAPFIFRFDISAFSNRWNLSLFELFCIITDKSHINSTTFSWIRTLIIHFLFSFLGASVRMFVKPLEKSLIHGVPVVRTNLIFWNSQCLNQYAITFALLNRARESRGDE